MRIKISEIGVVLSNTVYSFSQGVFYPIVTTLLIENFFGLKAVPIAYAIYNLVLSFSIIVSFVWKKKLKEKWQVTLFTILTALVMFLFNFATTEKVSIFLIFLYLFFSGIQIGPFHYITMRISERCYYFTYISFFFFYGLGGLATFYYFDLLSQNITNLIFALSGATFLSAILFSLFTIKVR